MATASWPVIGHQKIVRYLQSVAERHIPNHGYLFYGAPGLGKNLVADFFIKSILCRSGASKFCNTCSDCRQLDRGIHPDVVYLSKAEDKKNINVEEVREARSKIQNSSLLDAYKIMFIRDAETLSIGAVNALLKILEEPVGKTIFVFIAEDIKFLPRTFLSRLQVIKFLPVSHEDIENYLLAKNYSRSEAYELAHLSLGFPGRILPFLGHPKNLNEHKEKISDILRKLSGSVNERFRLVEQLAGQNNSEPTKINVRQFIHSFSALTRDALLIKSACTDKITHHWLRNELSVFSSKYSSGKIVRLLSEAKFTLRFTEQNVNLRLALENLVLAL